MDTQGVLRNAYELVKTVALVFVLSFLIRTFLVQTFVVQGKSMEPTFLNRDYLLVDKLSYRFSQPQRGQVVVFRNPENLRVDFVKRVIGLPNETVTISDGTLKINGAVLQEPYLIPQPTEAEQAASEFVLGPEEYYMLGDNRSNSLDSRRIGAVSRDHIVGRVFLRVLPISKLQLIRGPQFATP